ncbi:MAG: tetratricopeptide repeat protein [bacterium]
MRIKTFITWVFASLLTLVFTVTYGSAIETFDINPRYAEAYNNRGVVYYAKGEYDKAWKDVYKAQSLGYQVKPEFLKLLRKASGRQR